MVTQSEVIPYLMRRGLVDAASVVDSDLVVLDASRRNHNFKVVSQRSPSYLLKQGVGPDKTATVANESAVYKCLQSYARDNRFERYLPNFYGYDAEGGILILELVSGAQSLLEYHAHRGRFSTGLAMKMGDGLGALHRVTWMEGKKDQAILGFTHEPPWILSLHHPRLGMLRDISSANIQLIKIVQQFAEFGELLNKLRQEWKTQSLIHFDIKWDNCIVSAMSPLEHKNELKIVDWELAGIGDPCWDVGSVFNDYLGFWLLSIPITGEAQPDRFLELARYPLDKMQPAIGSFWQSYVRQMELDAAESDEWLLRAVRYAAARLVQTAFEQMQMSLQLTGNVVCFLQLSLNILQRPEEAIIHLLGIPLKGLKLP